MRIGLGSYGFCLVGVRVGNFCYFAREGLCVWSENVG